MFRNAIKYLFRLFLLSLPITFLPILNGVLGGILFTIWNSRHVDENVHHYLSEVDARDRLGDWNVPGTLSIHDFMDKNNDYHLTRLSTNTWLSTLGFILPWEFLESADAKLDNTADLDHLMQDVSSSPDLPREQWVYVTEFTMRDVFFSEWDTAFDEVIRYSYAHAALNNTGFSFIECIHSGFLCGVWHLKSPTLLHFMVEDTAPSEEDTDPELTYGAPRENLRPVTARVIEFPLNNAFLDLPLSVFPSAYEQMRAVVSTPGLYEQFEPYTFLEQILRRFNDYMDSIWEWKSSPFYYIRQIESWSQDYITIPLGLEPLLIDLQGVFFTTSMIVSAMVHWPIRFVWDSCKSFLGYPGPAEWMLRDPEEPRLDFMGNMFQGFIQDVMASPGKYAGTTADQSPNLTPAQSFAKTTTT